MCQYTRQNALKKVNEELIKMYWKVGEFLSKETEHASYGDTYIDEISREIQETFPGIKGFNRRGLYRMKKFYETYKDNEIVTPLVTQISWTNHLLIMSGCKTDEERECYIRLCIKENYSKRQFDKQGIWTVGGYGMNEEVKVMKDDRGVEYKCLTYTSRFTGETDVAFDIQQYMNNGNMYIGLGCNEEGYLEPFADLTVNLGDTTPNYCAYVDTNNLPDAETFIADNELGTYTGFVKRSGYCEYPLYMFNSDKLRELCLDGLAMYEKNKGIVSENKQKNETR